MEIKKPSKSVTDYLWVEKYRPRSFEEIVLDGETKAKFIAYQQDKEIPHLLFYGPPGCGKSTIARILVSYITPNESDVLILNGSEQRGIETVRTTIIEFLKYKPLSSKHKIVFIDEADSLTEQAFNALRRVFEEFYQNGRFIMTCNYVFKIPDPIRSRCTEFKFNELPVDFIRKRCYEILENEKIEYTEESVDKVVSYHYPDFRKIIQNLQKFSTNGKLKSITFDELVDKEDIVVVKTRELFLQLCNKDTVNANKYLDEICKIVTENELDYISIYKRLFNSEDIIAPVKIIVNEYMNDLNKSVLPSMHYIAFLFKSIEIIKKIII